tara:strand:- start:197 stop:1249 length:1053 start_codon:yes stop_codon:yes gene_type:complete
VKKTLKALSICRTKYLGGHMSVCKSCGVETISYNSCRNRHCPKCQVTNREKWILDRESELLPVPYYHIVFTLPHAFNELLPHYDKEIYTALFAASWLTIQKFAADPKYLGAKTGMVSILHTWGQQLWLHPHVHCIVPGGGITPSGKWKSCRYKDKYLFPKRALSTVFRATFMAELRKKISVAQHIAKKVFQTKWVVYAKRPFASPKTVVEYLGRYTHKIAISNHRLKKVDQENVIFTYKDYRQEGKNKQIKLGGSEFLRRFSSHILPSGFVRIRHYGFLASRNKNKELNLAKKDLNQPKWQKVKYSWVQIAKEKLNYNPERCHCCGYETLITTKLIAPERGPPLRQLKNA